MPKETTPSVAEQADERAAFLDLAHMYAGVNETPSGDLVWTFAQRDIENLATEVVTKHREAKHRAALAASQAASHSAPEPGKYFDAFLCRAWGETDLPSAEIVAGWDGVRAFMVREWLGDKDATHYDGTNTLDQLKIDFDEHEEDQRGGPYECEFEIGGVSIERITGFATPPAPLGAESKACTPSAPTDPVSIDPVAQIAVDADLNTLFAKLDWSARVLRAVADRGREGLGGSYPEVVQVWGAIKAAMENVNYIAKRPSAPDSKACASVGVREVADLLQDLWNFFAGPVRIAPTDENARAAMLWKRIEAALASPAPVGEPVSVGESLFEGWFQSYRSDLFAVKQVARDAYAAGMSDPLAGQADKWRGVYEAAIESFAAVEQFAASQQTLPADMAAILDANKWDLYALAAPAAAVPESPTSVSPASTQHEATQGPADRTSPTRPE